MKYLGCLSLPQFRVSISNKAIKKPKTTKKILLLVLRGCEQASGRFGERSRSGHVTAERVN